MESSLSSFSVVIPAFNVASIVERAIRSAAEQTLAPIEILVIDDCSTDSTVAVVETLRQEIPSIRLLSTAKNSGPSAARNVGLRAAKADWIALLDSDDAWKPERLERLAEVAISTQADFVADNLIMWDAGANAMVSPAYYDLEGLKQITLIDMFQADDNFNFTKKSLSLMKPIYRRQLLLDHELAYDERMKIGEDFTFYVEALFKGSKMVLIGDAYYIYSMPHAPSGRSPHSRSVYRSDGLKDLTSKLELKYQDRIDPSLRCAMHAYRNAMTLLYQSDVARDYKRSGRYAGYLCYLALRPELVGRLVARAALRLKGPTRCPPAIMPSPQLQHAPALSCARQPGAGRRAV